MVSADWTVARASAFTSLFEDDARPVAGVLVIDEVLASDPYARSWFAGRGPGPVLVDARYCFLQADSGDQDHLAGDAEAEFAGFGVTGAGEWVVRLQQRLADEVFRRSWLPAGTGRCPDRDRPGHVGGSEVVLGQKAV
jgi:hypothetical protein